MNDVQAVSEIDVILNQAKAVEKAKALKIQELLQESVDLETETVSRQAEIKAELKALGYKIPRKKKEEKVVDTATNVE